MPASCVTKRIPPQTLQNAINAILRASWRIEDGRPTLEVEVGRKLGDGGYNEVYLVSRLSDWDYSTTPKSFVLRLPKEESLLPYQVLNEVACISMIYAHCPNIPVPKIYAFDTETPNSFIAQEYMGGERLSSIWNRYTEMEKGLVALKIAEILVDMGELRFSGIGGFTGCTTHSLGPTVEGSKLYKGRGRFHSDECYPIGPYKTTKAYVLAYYDKEIYYYTHAPASDIDTALFQHTSLEYFVQELRDKRQHLETSYFAEDEPFVLVHGDFHGRNIMMQGSRVQAVLDWEFSGAFLLSELLGGGIGVDVLEVDDDESEKENAIWSRKIMHMVGETARNRGWDEKEIALLVGDGNPVLAYARTEMFPAV